jgi:copper chaperone
MLILGSLEVRMKLALRLICINNQHANALTFQREEGSKLRHPQRKELAMFTYRVEDMTCGHCASAITKAVRAVDSGAKVDVDLPQHLVRIVPTGVAADELLKVITEAGYTPVQVAAEAASTTGPSTRRGGCCGCCS